MNKATLEKYLKIYPKISDEISRLEFEICDLKNRKDKYRAFDSSEFVESIVDTIEVALESCRDDLMEAYKARTKITKGLSKINDTERKIIELRFWDNARDMQWVDIASELNYHKKTVEKIYRGTIKKMLIS